MFLDVWLNVGLRETKKLDNLLKSPVLNHISSTLAGLSVIRTFGRQNIFLERYFYSFLKKYHPSRLALGPSQPSIQWVQGLCPGGKVAGHGINQPPPTRDEVKEGVEQYLYSPSGLSWPFLG
jgi:hypothetical protein